MTDNGHDVLLPRRAGRFASIPDAIKDEGPAAGWRHARDILLERAEAMTKQMPLYIALKLALEFDKHAMFIDASGDAMREAEDQKTYEWFRGYLAGDSDIPVAVGLPSAATPASVHVVDADAEEEPDDGEDDE